MVPYVRKSFFKHYRDGLKYVCGYKDKLVAKETTLASGMSSADIPIDDRTAYQDDDAYLFAMDMTEREVYQAVEGMYHNLK